MAAVTLMAVPTGGVRLKPPNYGLGHLAEQSAVGRTQGARDAVHEAQGAQVLPAGRQQRRADVEAGPGAVAGDNRVRREPGAENSLFYHTRKS